MASPINIDLLKEYIKTFNASEVIFPGIPPRQFGVEFSSSELQEIYVGLKFVIQKAHPLQDKAMIAAFEQIEESGPLNLKWFLSDYWRDIVTILKLYPNVGDICLTNTYERIEYLKVPKWQ